MKSVQNREVPKTRYSMIRKLTFHPDILIDFFRFMLRQSRRTLPKEIKKSVAGTNGLIEDWGITVQLQGVNMFNRKHSCLSLSFAIDTDQNNQLYSSTLTCFLVLFRDEVKQRHMDAACCISGKILCVQTVPGAEERDKEHMRLG